MAIFRVKDIDGNIYDIPVVKGEPGYTPRRGDDYFTDSDIQEFKNYANEEIAEHAASTNNPHDVTAEQVGLGNVDNTSDKDKPVSTAQAEAIFQAKSVTETHIKDDGNPHNVTFAQVGAASAGYGYGETMKWLGYDEVNNKASGTFQADLKALFAEMPSGTCKQIQFMDSALNTQKFTGTLWKYTSAYGVLTALNYSGCKAVKTFYGGSWEPWEWENPPMETGKEYRTTERYNGKVVYAKNVSFGKLPNNTEKTVEHGLGGGQIDTIVSFDVLVYETGSTTVRKLPFFTTAGALRADGYITNARVGVVTQANLSDHTAMVRMRYTRA